MDVAGVDMERWSPTRPSAGDGATHLAGDLDRRGKTPIGHQRWADRQELVKIQWKDLRDALVRRKTSRLPLPFPLEDLMEGTSDLGSHPSSINYFSCDALYFTQLSSILYIVSTTRDRLHCSSCAVANREPCRLSARVLSNTWM